MVVAVLPGIYQTVQDYLLAKDAVVDAAPWAIIAVASGFALLALGVRILKSVDKANASGRDYF